MDIDVEEDMEIIGRAAFGFVNSVIIFVIVVLSIAAFRIWSKEVKLQKKSDIEDHLKNNPELSKSKITVFFNRTRYMLSTFGSGHFIGTGTVFMRV